MEWSKGISASYYAYIIDPISWRETERIEITGGTISRDREGLRDAADIDTARYRQKRELYIRIYFDAEQRGAATHTPLFTGLACSPERNIDGVLETNTLKCYSVLKAADDFILPPGYWVTKDLSGARIIKELLSVVPAPIEVEGEAPSLQQYIVAEDGETRLTMADKVLNAINWRMYIDGLGVIHLAEYSDEPVARLDPLSNDIIEPSITVNYDWYSVPNAFRAINNDTAVVVKDESEESTFSIPNRGREVWAEDSSCDLNSGESLSEYAMRRLKELQQVSLSVSYERRFIPQINVDDVIRLHYPQQGIDGLYRVASQKIELSYGAKVSEEIEAL